MAGLMAWPATVMTALAGILFACALVDTTTESDLFAFKSIPFERNHCSMATVQSSRILISPMKSDVLMPLCHSKVERHPHTDGKMMTSTMTIVMTMKMTTVTVTMTITDDVDDNEDDDDVDGGASYVTLVSQ